jgi:hypothetical protein
MQGIEKEYIKEMLKELKINFKIESNLVQRKENNEIYWSHLSINTVFDAEDHIANYVLVNTDISELQAQKELISKKHELLTSNLKYALRMGKDNKKFMTKILKNYYKRFHTKKSKHKKKKRATTFLIGKANRAKPM